MAPNTPLATPSSFFTHIDCWNQRPASSGTDSTVSRLILKFSYHSLGIMKTYTARSRPKLSLSREFTDAHMAATSILLTSPCICSLFPPRIAHVLYVPHFIDSDHEQLLYVHLKCKVPNNSNVNISPLGSLSVAVSTSTVLCGGHAHHTSCTGHTQVCKHMIDKRPRIH